METLMKPEMCTGNDDWMITNVKLKILDADLLAQFWSLSQKMSSPNKKKTTKFNTFSPKDFFFYVFLIDGFYGDYGLNRN